jgi:hypothetical protein
MGWYAVQIPSDAHESSPYEVHKSQPAGCNRTVDSTRSIKKTRLRKTRLLVCSDDDDDDRSSLRAQHTTLAMRATRLPDPTAQADRASTISGSSLAEPFPDVSQSQYDAIARVVAALPPGTSTWASFSEAYARLDVDEEDCYSLFLKLSLERGRDWHEKWEAAKASLEGRRIATGEQGGVGGTFELLRRKVNSVTSPAPATTGRTARPPSTPAGIAEPRVRSTTTPRPRSVPFQVAPRSTRDFLVRATHECTSSSEDDLPIPRIETPPSHRPRSSLSRPRPRESLPPPSLSFSPPPDPDVPFVPSSHLTKLDTAATHFRRLSLLSTFFAGWRTQHSFLLLQASKADSARRAIDLSQSLLHWRDQLGRLRQKQRGLRDLERVWRKGRLRTVWKEWGRRVGEKKEREKLERGRLRDEKMRKALVTVGKKWEGKAMRECFDVSLFLPCHDAVLISIAALVSADARRESRQLPGRETSGNDSSDLATTTLSTRSAQRRR